MNLTSSLQTGEFYPLLRSQEIKLAPDNPTNLAPGISTVGTEQPIQVILFAK